MSIPFQPKIYHITPISNLEGMFAAGGIRSDANCLKYNLNATIIGMSKIKQRRLKDLEVKCYPGKKVGEFVPFYFCPRSVMLYILYKGNHPDISYQEGQNNIVHLELDLKSVTAWANKHYQPWALSDRNAGAIYTQFSNDFNDLQYLDWKAIQATDFREASVKDGKQAEFLLYDFLPLHLIEKIGVYNQSVYEEVGNSLKKYGQSIPVSIMRHWYFF